MDDQSQRLAERASTGEVRGDEISADPATGGAVEFGRQDRGDHVVDEVDEVSDEFVGPHRHVARADDRLRPSPGESFSICAGHHDWLPRVAGVPPGPGAGVPPDPGLAGERLSAYTLLAGRRSR